jgi:hypothetical protein
MLPDPVIKGLLVAMVIDSCPCDPRIYTIEGAVANLSIYSHVPPTIIPNTPMILTNVPLEIVWPTSHSVIDKNQHTPCNTIIKSIKFISFHNLVRISPSPQEQMGLLTYWRQMTSSRIYEWRMRIE